VSAPSVPVSLKRKAAALEQEEDEAEKARRLKITQFMNPRMNRSHGPTCVSSAEIPKLDLTLGLSDTACSTLLRTSKLAHEKCHLSQSRKSKLKLCE
jgi:hypothetical protein